jgi:tetratricopeptide (TPR) repeat protein
VSNLGLAHLLAARWPEACRRFDEAVAMAPDNPAILLNSADCRLAAGDPRALALYEKTLRLLGDPATDDYVSAIVRAQAAAHVGQGDDAIGAINEALRLAPNNPEVSYAAAVVYAVLGERQSAIRHARLSLQRGLEPRWFSLPWFDQLRQEPALAPLLGVSITASPPS